MKKKFSGDGCWPAFAEREERRKEGIPSQKDDHMWMIVDVTELLRGHHKREVNSAFEQVFLDPPFSLFSLPGPIVRQ